MKIVLRMLLLSFCFDYLRFRFSLIRPYAFQRKLKKKLEISKSTPIKTFEKCDFSHRKDIVMTVPTSGSSSRRKNIPYNKALLRSFDFMFKVWCFDLRHYLWDLGRNTVLVSISPPTEESGDVQDSDYLMGLKRYFFKYFCITADFKSATYMEDLAEKLFNSKDLQVISVWSPSYLFVLLNLIEQKHGVQVWSRLWPNLKLISCWDSAGSENGASRLRKMFPSVFVQGKGLLATEAPMTIPVVGVIGQLPLVSEIYYEFRSLNGEIVSLDQVKVGAEYEIIISQKSGLIRYPLGDKVRVVGKFSNTPVLQFLGRAGEISDMVGEKVNLSTVRESFVERGIVGDFVIVPSEVEEKYYFLLDGDTELTDIDEVFSESFHYKVARKNKQLKRAEFRMVPGLRLQLKSFFESRGMKSGDIKDVELLRADQGDSFLEFIDRAESFQRDLETEKPLET